MKIEITHDKVIVYLYIKALSINDIALLNKEIKSLFINLIERYHLNFFGSFKVSIYHNSHYGSILEIEKAYDDSFNTNLIDLKIIVYRNVSMYLEFNDFYFTNVPKQLIIKNNKYYLSVDNIDNIMKYIEYGRINYNTNFN